MTLHDAIGLLERFKNETQNKSEIKVYEQFRYMLVALEKKDLAQEDVQSIESELDRLNISVNPGNRKKHLKKALLQFEKFLNDSFSFISKGHYTKLGIGLGSSFGIVFGIVLLSGWERSLGISAGLTAGMIIGLLIGRTMDAQAKAAGKML